MVSQRQACINSLLSVSRTKSRLNGACGSVSGHDRVFFEAQLNANVTMLTSLQKQVQCDVGNVQYLSSACYNANVRYFAVN